MSKNYIRLTEQDLRRIVKESVSMILREAQLNELDPRTYASYAQKRRVQAKNSPNTFDRLEYYDKAFNGDTAARNAWNKEYGYNPHGFNDEDKFFMHDMSQYGDDKSLYNISRHYSDGTDYSYNPTLNKGYLSHAHNQNTDTEYNHNILHGKEGKGAYIANQMATGSGKYEKGKGWK